jgi:hypothetical protein
MGIVSATYFKAPIDIDYSKATTVEKIGYYSDYCEDFYLKKLLGNNEYYKYVTDKALTEDHDPKYVALLASSTFEYSGVTYKNDILQMLAYFMYPEIVSDSQGFNTSLGEMSANVDNSKSIIPIAKIIRSFNLGIELYNCAELYLSVHVADFPDYETACIKSINSFGI